MNQHRIQQVTRSLSQVDSRDTASQAALLGDLALLCSELENSGDWGRAHTAQAATQLLQYLTQLGCIGPEGIIKVVTLLVNSLNDPTSPVYESEEDEDGESDAKPFAREQAGRAAAALPVTRPRSPRAPLPAFRDIDLSNSKTDLRMLSDCLLGEVMIQMNLIKRDALDRALEVQSATGVRIGEALVEVGAATWDQIKVALRQQEDQKQK